MKSKKSKSKKSKKTRKSRNNKQYGGNQECSIKVRRNDYQEEVNYYKDKNCDVFYYEDDNNFYKLRKRNKYNIFGKTRCTSNPPSGSLRKLCKNNRILQSEAFREKIFERGQRASRKISEKKSQQMPPMDPINEERQINLPRTSSYISPLTEKIEKNMFRSSKTQTRKRRPSVQYSKKLTSINESERLNMEQQAETLRTSNIRGM